MTSINITTAKKMKEPAEFCDFALFSIAVMRQCEFCPLSKGKKKKKKLLVRMRIR